jgi:putative hydrolase of the HAD superfamily
MNEWLLCDYGQVLSQAPPLEEWEALQALAGVADFPEIYWLYRPEYDRGDVTAAEYWTSVMGRAPSATRLAELIALDTGMWLHLDPEALDGAERAAQRGFRLALFSNAPLEVAAGIDGLQPLGQFQPRFFSCRLRAIKPEPQAYAQVLSTLGAAPEDVVFVDDRPANVEAASALGMRAVLFEGPEQFEMIARRAA